MSSTVIFLWVLTISLLFSVVTPELVLLQVLYRHGDRSPIRIYPTDPNKETKWPLGLGELTKIGKEQEYELGQLLRIHYGNNLKFIENTFNVKDVYVRSTDYDRTLMSAYCMLAGLFPPTKKQTWNTKIPWQPIPVHTVPQKDEDLLCGACPCPAYGTKFSYFMSHDPEVLKTIEDNQDLIKYVAENSGLAATYDGMGKIMDTIFCEQKHNMSQPPWLLKKTSEGKTAIDRVMYIRKHYVKWWIPTHELAVLKGGPLLKKIYQNMWTKLNKPENITQKVFIYSGHDTNVIALLKAMKIFNDMVPQYSSCVMVELHDDKTVRILFRNNTHSKQNFTLQLPGCAEFCPLEKFRLILNDSMPADMSKACGIEDSNAKIFKHNIIGYSVMGCIIFLLLILTTTMCCIYHRQRLQYRYMELPTDLTDTAS